MFFLLPNQFIECVLAHRLDQSMMLNRIIKLNEAFEFLLSNPLIVLINSGPEKLAIFPKIHS